MEISCDIIRDVLPLYAEDLVSNDTRNMVDEHLCKCDPCTKQLGILKKAAELPIEVETHSLERVSHSIKKQKILTVLCVLTTILSILWGSMVFMMSPVYLTADQAIEGVELRADGGLAIDMGNGHTGYMSYNIGEHDKVMSANTTRYDLFRARIGEKRVEAMSEAELEAHAKQLYGVEVLTQKEWDRYHNVYVEYNYINAEGVDFTYPYSGAEEHVEEVWGYGPVHQTQHDYDLWYLGPDGRMSKLIWNGGDGECEAVYHDPANLANQFNISMIVVAVFAAVFLAFACICKNEKWKEYIFGVGSVCASIVTAFLIITGCDFVDDIGSRAVMWSNHLVSLSAVLAATALSWRQLYLLNRKEKGL